MRASAKPWWAAAAAALLTAVAVLWLAGRGYGEMSDHGYQYAKALFRACNQREDATLERISQMVQASLQAEEIRPAEAKWLATIIDKARSEDWDGASRDVRRLMEAQVRRP